nr:septal ring lytic transglycosylase RlpA family protein [uncultured Marinifilum sp.]
MKSIYLSIGFVLLSLFVKSQVIKCACQNGKASYYSDYLEGHKTASGEIFHQNKFTAAHPSLSFGTWVKVLNLTNKKSVIVRINDRGPFVKARIIDLSKSAAKHMGNINKGVFMVSIQVHKKDTCYISIDKKRIQRLEYQINI